MPVSQQICAACGSTLPAGALFCRVCGAQVEAAPAAPGAAPAAGAPVSSGAQETRYEAPPPRAPAPPPSGPPPRAGQAPAPQAGWQAAGTPQYAQPPVQPVAPPQYAQPPGLGGPPPYVPQTPVMTTPGGRPPRRGMPPWVLVVIIVVVLLALAGGAIAIWVLPGDEGKVVASDTPTPAVTVTSTPSVSPSPTALSEATQLTSYKDSMDPILGRWDKLVNKLYHVIWEETHQRSDSTWPPSGRKVRALTDKYNGITSAVWAVDTPDFLRPATQSLLTCARLEHKYYDLIGDWLVNDEDWSEGSPNGKTYHTLKKAATKAWKAYLRTVRQEERRLGVSSD